MLVQLAQNHETTTNEQQKKKNTKKQITQGHRKMSEKPAKVERKEVEPGDVDADDAD